MNRKKKVKDLKRPNVDNSQILGSFIIEISKNKQTNKKYRMNNTKFMRKINVES